MKNHRKIRWFFSYIYDQLAKFFDTKEELARYRDSENVMLRDMEKDAILAANRAGLDINELATEIEIETTYEPCSICKREIMLRQQSVGDHTKSL